MSVTTKPTAKSETTLLDRVAKCAHEGHESINARLSELESEWTASRMVKATLGILIFAGFILATVHNPYWLILPAIAGGLLLQYVFWRGGLLTELYCKFGYRSGMQIDEERFALRTLRGDYRNLPTVDEVEDKESIGRFEDEGGPAVEAAEQLYGPREAATIIVAAGKELRKDETK